MKQALWLDSISNNKILKYSRLKGGVSSEVYKVVTKKNIYCIKRSLKKLLVQKEWIVDQNRIYYEYLWLVHCKKILKQNVPVIYDFNKEENYIIMEYLDNTKYKTLKELYFEKKINFSTIKSISKHLYKIHSLSNDVKTMKIFRRNNQNFFDLRLDPYFNEVARVFPELNDKVKQINKSYRENSSTLVHGDFSPKNILIGKNRILYLDAECCNYGDPVFDLVFFSNHLLIKSMYFESKKKEFLEAFKIFYNHYLKNFNKKNKINYLKRIIDMIPIMLLARVDGKSPVEYIKSKKLKNNIREKSFKMIKYKLLDLDDIIKIIYEK